MEENTQGRQEDVVYMIVLEESIEPVEVEVAGKTVAVEEDSIRRVGAATQETRID